MMKCCLCNITDRQKPVTLLELVVVDQPQMRANMRMVTATTVRPSMPAHSRYRYPLDAAT